MNERLTIGDEKVSVTITRKTREDLLVSQHSSERWFSNDSAASAALRRLMNVFVEAETELLADGDELTRRRERAGHGEKRDESA